QPLLAADESGSAFADEAKLLNDDALERLARRRSQAAPSDPLQRMTARELSDHYENCIKLSVEGKISSKNAFALHLIDYLQGTVKGIDNFQLASSSLDAGAKIYAGRVDAVHREAYKVMGGLGRNDANPAAADSDGDEEAGGAAAAEVAGDDEAMLAARAAAAAKRRQRKRKAVIATSLTRIRLKPASLRFDVDPLFHQQAAAYDNGGTGEMRLNNVCVIDNDCEILLDSDATLNLGRQSVLAIANVAWSDPPCDLPTPGVGALATVARSAAHTICGHYANFVFANPTARVNGAENDESLIATVAPVASQAQDLSAADPPDVDMVDDDDDIVDDDARDDHAGVDATLASAVADDNAGGDVTIVPGGATSATVCSVSFIDGLRDLLWGDESDWELGGQRQASFRLGAWTGPAQWRRKCRLTSIGGVFGPARLPAAAAAEQSHDNPADQGESAAGPPSAKRPRRSTTAAAAALKAQTNRLLSAERIDWLAKLAKPQRTDNKMSDCVVNANMNRVLDLPPPAAPRASTIGPDNSVAFFKGGLLSLTIDSRHVVRFSAADVGKQTDTGSDEEDCSDDSNNNRRPALHDFAGVNEDEDDHHGGYEEFDEGYEGATRSFANFRTALDAEGVGDNQDYDMLNCSDQQRLWQQQKSGFLDNMSQAPGYQVRQVMIDYAKTAKRINVKRLKTSMWRLLAQPDGIGIENQQQPASSSQESAAAADAEDQWMPDSPASFASMLELLPRQLGSAAAVEDLSVSIVFTCLLYLANEKKLDLSSSASLADIIVSPKAPDDPELLAAQGLKLLTAKKSKTKMKKLKKPARSGQGEKRQYTLNEIWGSSDEDDEADEVV
ncbi:hypothetical protein BOX15_Mlig008001g3, partial [Macrostomum lignano]